jgi:hypothetical protein
MKEFAPRAWPVWLISTLVGGAVVCATAVYLALRRSPPPPSPPPAVVVSICRDPAPGVRRVGSGIAFDVPVAGFALRSGMPDAGPPMYVHDVTVERGSPNPLEISDQVYFERALQSAWPVFSEHVEERDVRNVHGHVVGKDRWGCFRTGRRWKRWRFVSFDGGEEAAYPPTSDREAQLYDQIISSACSPATPGR